MNGFSIEGFSDPDGIVPIDVLWKSLELNEKCRCDQCKRHKERLEKRIYTYYRKKQEYPE